jgi:hypothetical protein
VLFDADMACRAATAFSRVPNLCSLVSTQYGEAAMQAARSRWRLQVVRVLDAVTGRLFVRQFHAVSEVVSEHARTRLRLPGNRIRVVPAGGPWSDWEHRHRNVVTVCGKGSGLRRVFRCC